MKVGSKVKLDSTGEIGKVTHVVGPILHIAIGNKTVTALKSECSLVKSSPPKLLN